MKKSTIAITLSTVLGSGSAWAADDMSSIEARLAAMEQRLQDAAETRAQVAEKRAAAAEQKTQQLAAAQQQAQPRRPVAVAQPNRTASLAQAARRRFRPAGLSSTATPALAC